MSQQKWYEKNLYIILWIVFFFPIGIYGLLKRYSNKTNKDTTSNSKGLKSLKVDYEKIIEDYKIPRTKSIDNNLNKKDSTTLISDSRYIQALETIYILETTKNLDTFLGRCDFIAEVYLDLVTYSFDSRYDGFANKNIHLFIKSKNIELNETQRSLLIKPKDFDIRNFYLNVFTSFIENSYFEFKRAIDKLKRIDAKLRKLSDFRNSIKSLESSSSFYLESNHGSDWNQSISTFKMLANDIEDELNGL